MASVEQNSVLAEIAIESLLSLKHDRTQFDTTNPYSA
jgi:hypothetical protein